MLSIIIPTYNEADDIGRLIHYLKRTPGMTKIQEIIVVDGGSTDATIEKARDAGACIVASKKGRAIQQNIGARHAKGDVLYFLHADTYPPKTFIADIGNALQKGYASGSFRLRFDHSHWFLGVCTFIVHRIAKMHFGDQSMFIVKALFRQIRGFDERKDIMEDYDMVRRLKKHSRFIMLDTYVVTSARKYIAHGIYKLHNIYLLIFILYLLNLPQRHLKKVYHSLVGSNEV